MPVNIKRGYAFKSELSLRIMKAKLDAVSPKPWDEGDRAYRDYLGGRLNKDGVARLGAASCGTVRHTPRA